MAGFKRKRKVYKLDFAGTEYDGLEVRVSGLTTGEYLELVSLSGPTEENDHEAEAMIRMFQKHLISWNLLDENGKPLDTSYESVADNEFTMNTAIVNAWTAALANVPDETAKKLPTTDDSQVESIPTETL